MAIHDAWARRTPYELVLPDADAAAELFRAVESEAEERSVDATDPDAFVLLGAVGEAMRETRGPADDPALVRQHGLLLFHAWRFSRAAEPLLLLSAPAARWVAEGDGPGAGVDVRPPAPAGYLQLPWHLFWARTGAPGEEGDAAATPESLDGVFWSASAGRVSVLAALGLRGDRPGFSVIPLPPVPQEDASSWAAAETMRDDGRDFASDMPGADLERLYEVRTAGEILKLLARAWTLVDPLDPERREAPWAGSGGRADPGGEGARPGGPEPSGLAFYRISLE